jgi:hypothetical protein
MSARPVQVATTGFGHGNRFPGGILRVELTALNVQAPSPSRKQEHSAKSHEDDPEAARTLRLPLGSGSSVVPLGRDVFDSPSAVE